MARQINRAHKVELLLFSAIQHALAKNQIVQLNSLLNAYTRGFASIAEAEEKGLAAQIKRRELLPIAECKSVVAEILTPLRQALETLPLTERADAIRERPR